MSTLAVLAFPTETGAALMLSDIDQKQKEGLITLDDAATVVRNPDGKAKVKQATSLVGEGSLGGAFWGMLIGLLFFMPWMGMAVGAVTGALTGKFADIGIDDSFIKEVANEIAPGTSALFLLVREATVDKLAAELPNHDFRIIHTALPKDREDALKEAFGVS